ncbi:hypothetical protein N9760_04015 [Schleiferiaceae bacterium]|nr:hypothetical protein [Schleiferiaceae bacterium]
MDLTVENKRKGLTYFEYSFDAFPYLNHDWFEENKEFLGRELLETLEEWKYFEGQMLRDYYSPTVEGMVGSDTIEIDVVEGE